MYELGDTLSNRVGRKIIVIMTFFMSNSINNKIGSEEVSGFWGCDDDLKEILPYYEGETEELNDFKSYNKMNRSRCLLIEKDFNIALQKKAAKKFASILLTHL